MQHSAQKGSVKRQDRVPLAALVELRGVDLHGVELRASGDELVEADGLNVSIGGIAMRVSHAPRLGELITCRFSCPPTGELVRAQGQVVWSEQTTPERGAFGLRFVELDTKSATALRRLVSPDTVAEARADRPRTVALSIDGLGSSIDAGLKLADDSRLVLEQRLSFLQLGRSVEVTVPGRGKERGRIASVELRQSQCDAPTLVYGVLLDGAPGRVVEAAEPGAVALFTTPVGTVPYQDHEDADAQSECDSDESALDLNDHIHRFSELPSDVTDDELSSEPTSIYYSRVVAPAVRDKERSSRVPPPAAATGARAEEAGAATRELASVDTHPGIGPSALLYAAETLGGNAESEQRPLSSASSPTARATSSSTMPPAAAAASASSSERTLEARYSLPAPAAAAVVARRPARNTRQELAEAALAHGEAGSSTDIDGRAAFQEDRGPDRDASAHAEPALAPGAARFDMRSGAGRRANMRIEDTVYGEDDRYEQGHDDDHDADLDEEAGAHAGDDDDAPLELQSTPDAVVALPARQVRTLPTQLRSFFRVPVARFQKLRLRFEPALRQQTEFLDLPAARARLLLHLARGRAAVLRGWSGIRKSTATVRSRKSRPMRMQRTTLPGVGLPGELELPRPPQTARIAALALAALGIALGVYALAPRSGADRIRIPERVEPETAVAEPTIELHDEGVPLDEPVVPAAPRPRAKRGKARDTTPPSALDEAAAVVAAPAAPVVSAPFGEAEVPNGRVFTLRMNGPVEQVEGEARENGLTVRVPGRLALDRASPIASSHSAVSRAMILNRGGYAELTIDFLPGLSPRYQVRGRDNTLEVTLERP